MHLSRLCTRLKIHLFVSFWLPWIFSLNIQFGEHSQFTSSSAHSQIKGAIILLDANINSISVLFFTSITFASFYCTSSLSTRYLYAVSMGLRVVSLLPSATEILCISSEKGSNDELLVGRSHECDFPPYVTDRPILTAAKTKFESCAQINEEVGKSLAAGEGLYSLDTKLLTVRHLSLANSHSCLL